MGMYVLCTGACESSMACSTCHVVLEDNVFEHLEPACEDEEDMLDMAFGLTDTYVFCRFGLAHGAIAVWIYTEC